MSGCPTADLSAATTNSNGLEQVMLNRSSSTFAIVIFSSVAALAKKGAPQDDVQINRGKAMPLGVSQHASCKARNASLVPWAMNRI
jgi:hypothetical protein